MPLHGKKCENVQRTPPNYWHRITFACHGEYAADGDLDGDETTLASNSPVGAQAQSILMRFGCGSPNLEISYWDLKGQFGIQDVSQNFGLVVARLHGQYIVRLTSA